jgi:ribonucleotide reductase beta subunit family protein with ferritin-like domain
VTDIINIENKLRHFTPQGYSRSFLLGFYAKLSLIHIKKMNETMDLSPLIIRDEHIEFMKWSKAKSARIDWLLLQLIQYDHFFGTERMNALLQSGSRYESLFALLSANEQKQVIENCMTYGSSINDSDIFLTDVTTLL